MQRSKSEWNSQLISGVGPGISDIRFRNIPISEAHKANVILAHGFMNKKLPEAHGAPVRALVPDRYFYKSVKWLEGIKFSAVDEPGYYESGGYSNTADPWKEERFD